MNLHNEIPQLDVEVVRAFLAGLLGTDVSAVEFIASGAWSRCFGFVHEGRNQVVRFGDHLEDFEKDRIAAGYREPNLPVPEISAVGEAFGGHYAIASRLYGKPLDQLSPAEWIAILPGLLRTLDSVRAADISATTGYGIWDVGGRGSCESWREFLLSAADDPPGRRTNGWRRRLRESPRDETAFFEALRRLEKSVDRCPEDRHLIHSDLHPNVLVDGSTVTGLLDWGCSLYGDFVYDHAWLAFWAPWYPAANGIDFARESLRHLRTLGIDDDLEHRMLCCQVRVGLDAIAYNAFTRRAADLQATAQLTVELARSLAKLQ